MLKPSRIIDYAPNNVGEVFAATLVDDPSLQRDPKLLNNETRHIPVCLDQTPSILLREVSDAWIQSKLNSGVSTRGTGEDGIEYYLLCQTHPGHRLMGRSLASTPNNTGEVFAATIATLGEDPCVQPDLKLVSNLTKHISLCLDLTRSISFSEVYGAWIQSKQSSGVSPKATGQDGINYYVLCHIHPSDPLMVPTVPLVGKTAFCQMVNTKIPLPKNNVTYRPEERKCSQSRHLETIPSRGDRFTKATKQYVEWVGEPPRLIPLQSKAKNPFSTTMPCGARSTSTNTSEQPSD